MTADIVMAGDAADEAPQFVQASSSSGLEYLLHPLVLINISDHFMRIRMSGDEATPRVVGCLLGEQTGRTVDISNSFEMVATGDDASPDFKRDVFDAKLSQYSECFKSLHVLGWYSTGGPVQERELQLHKKFMEHTETRAPILLMLDTARAMTPAAKELPVDMFESGIHVMDGVPQTVFAKAAYSMATSDAERIGVNAAANVTPSGAATESALSQHCSSLHSALQMLGERVQIIHAFCLEMQNGQVPVDHQVLRMLKGLLDMMPTMTSQAFQKELTVERTDVMLINMLCMVTKGVEACNQLVQCSGEAYSRR